MKTREEGGQLVAEEAIYATKDGRLVGEDDPEANELVAAAGTAIREKSAQKYGLRGAKKESAKDAEHVIGEDQPSQTKRKIT